jgi:hypothetical protein
MNKGSTSYYYMSSSNMTTYNENGSAISKQHVRIDNNGNKDHYYKESVIEDNEEKIINENGNRKLQPKKNYVPISRTKQNSYFNPDWADLLFYNSDNNYVIDNKPIDNHIINDKPKESNTNENITTEEKVISNKPITMDKTNPKK